MKKRQKSKMTMLIVGGLTAVSLVSVGFASWVVNEKIPDDENITVTVGSVDNQSLTTTIIPAGVGGSALSVSFDNTSETVGKNGVFSGTTSEDLAFSIKIQIDGKISTYLNSITLDFDGGIAGTSDKVNPLTTSVESTDYLAYPWLSTRSVKFNYNKGENTLSVVEPIPEAPSRATIAIAINEKTDDKIVCTATFTFGWGQAFAYVNPALTPIKENNAENPITKSQLIERLENFKDAYDKITGKAAFNVEVTPNKA